MAGVALKRHHPPHGFSRLFFVNKQKRRHEKPYERFVWRCEWFEGYILPIVKHLKHNTFQLYALKNTLFYVLLILLLPACNEFNKILDFHKIWKKISRVTKIPKILSFSGSSKIYNFRQNRGPHFLKFRGIMVVTICKSVRIYVFPEIFEIKFNFFPEKCQPQFLVFIEIWGYPFLEFTGIPVVKIAKNTKIYGFPWILETPFRIFPGNFYEIPKSPIFLNFRKPRNFGERVTSTKKVPNFQFSPGFSLNFVELIRYTPHPNLYA